MEGISEVLEDVGGDVMTGEKGGGGLLKLCNSCTR